MDSRLSDEQLFLLYLVKYDWPRHLRDRQNSFEKFDDGQSIERFWLTKATTLALLAKMEHCLEYPSDRNQQLPPVHQLVIPLRYYATGSFQLVVADLAGVSKSTACHTVHKVSEAIAGLRSQYVVFCARTTLPFPSDMLVYDDDHAHWTAHARVV